MQGRVAIQIENHQRGLQSMEDRIVVVKPKSEADAMRRLKKEWQAYAAPFFNYRGEYARWKLEAIEDVYEILDDEINPSGTEVFSRLYRRRRRPETMWRIRYRR
jgi:hypothetical protein